MRKRFGLVVLTGGPGAGKTAVLEMAKRTSHAQVAFLPEAASVIFGGGFWRLHSQNGRKAAQRAIYHVQREMEEIVRGESLWLAGVCDRGTLDGLAYWPGTEKSYWKSLGSSHAEELARYSAIIHLRTPSAENGYNHQNTLRIETPEEAQRIDEKIERIWRKHPRYLSIESQGDFMVKAAKALDAIDKELAFLKGGA